MDAPVPHPGPPSAPSLVFPTAESIELVAPSHHGGLLRRAVWSFAGQAVSSGSNFLLSVLVLSVAQPDEFAVFSLCVVTYGTILQLTRASVAVPATLLDGGRSQQRAAIGVTVGLGIAAGAVIVLVSLLVGAGRSLLLPLGLLLPFLLFQDALRYACYAEGRPSAAAASDMAWLGLQAAASVVLLASGHGTATTLVVAWAVAGTVSGLAAGAWLHLAPALPAAARWVGTHRVLWQRLLGEFVLASSSHQAVYYGLALVAGAGEVGRVKATQTLLGPLVILILGGGALGVPESVRAAGDPARLRQVAVRLSAFLVAAALACGAVAHTLLPHVGPDLFPHNWAEARPLIPVLTLFTCALGASIGAVSALRALDHNAWLLRLRAAAGAVVVVVGVAASALFGAEGALASLAAIESVVAVLAWRRFAAIGRGAAATVGA